MLHSCEVAHESRHYICVHRTTNIMDTERERELATILSQDKQLELNSGENVMVSIAL